MDVLCHSGGYPHWSRCGSIPDVGIASFVKVEGTGYGREEPEHLSLNLVCAIRPAQTICHNSCVQVLPAGDL